MPRESLLLKHSDIKHAVELLRVDGRIAPRTDRALRNVAATLTAAGSSMDKVVRCNVFLTKMSDFSSMNEVYATFFAENPPARTTLAAAELPKDVLIEIQVIAAG